MWPGIVLIAAAAVSWGTTGSVGTILADRAAASPLLVGLARLWVAAVFLIAGVLVVRLVGASSLTGIAPQDRWRCMVMGACMAAYQAAFFSAVPLAGIAAVALIAICSAPLIIAVLAVGLLGERITRRIGLALALGTAGTALLMAGPQRISGASGGHVLAGALLALGAGAAYAIYAVMAKAAVARSAALPLAAATFGIAAVLLTPVLAAVDGVPRQIALGWPWLLYLGGVATAAAYVLYTIGLRRVPASVAGIVTLLEPLTATLLGVAVFGEHLGAVAATGAALMFGALATLAAISAPSRK